MDLHIRSFRSRFQGSDRAVSGNALQRCRAARAAALEGELEGALARLAGDDEVIVLRRVEARVRLAAGGSTQADARAFSDGVAQALGSALRHAPARACQRWPRRRQALVAFVQDAIAGDVARDWVWQRLGWLQGGAAIDTRAGRDALLRRLADDPRDADAGVPLLRAILPTPAWPALVALLSDGELRGLAQSVWLRLGGTGPAGFDAGPAVRAPDLAPAPVAPPVASPAGLAAVWPATARAAATPVRQRWALRLACLLAEPLLARRGSAAVDHALQAFSTAAPGDAPPPGGPRHGSAAAPAHSGAGALPAARTVAPRAPEDAPRPAADSQPVRGPHSARTAHGGLLLLLPLLEPCGALALLERTAPRPIDSGDNGDSGWSLQTALHRLALLLHPMAGDDPAALAFCGRGGAGAPPEHSEAVALSPNGDAGTPVQAARDCLLHALAERLPDWRGPALATRVVRRAATVAVEPGWMDVTYAMRDVSTELRRSALDLDPGFIPWLGSVLRFRYE